MVNRTRWHYTRICDFRRVKRFSNGRISTWPAAPTRATRTAWVRRLRARHCSRNSSKRWRFSRKIEGTYNRWLLARRMHIYNRPRMRIVAFQRRVNRKRWLWEGINKCALQIILILTRLKYRFKMPLSIKKWIQYNRWLGEDWWDSLA